MHFAVGDFGERGEGEEEAVVVVLVMILAGCGEAERAVADCGGDGVTKGTELSSFDEVDIDGGATLSFDADAEPCSCST